MPKRQTPTPAADTFIGQTIANKFSGYGNTLYPGTITSYNATKGKYEVIYEDGTLKLYSYDQLVKYGLQLKTSPAGSPSEAKKTRFKTPVSNLPQSSPPTGTSMASSSTSASATSSASSSSSSSSTTSTSAASTSAVGKRKRKQRFVTVGGHTVLKANMYDLNQGISTFSGSSANVRRRALSKISPALSAYTIFCKEKGYGVGGDAGAAWKQVSQQQKEVYATRAARDKIRYKQEMAEREQLLRDLEDEDKRIAIEEEDKEARQQLAKVEAKRTAAALKRAEKLANAGKPKKDRRSAKQIKLTEYNKSVKSTIEGRKERRNLYLTEHANALRTFVGDQILNKLDKSKISESSKSSKSKQSKTSASSSSSSSTSSSSSSSPLPTSGDIPAKSQSHDVPSHITETPSFIKTGKLRDYQIEGVNWLIEMHRRGTNAILADEMGLGKTLQTITFLSYLKYHDKIEGPSLIVVPLSVLTAWCKEFKKWCPTMNVLQFHSSDQDERERIRQKLLRTPLSVDVVVTTYDMMTSNNMNYALSKQIYWRYVVMDEGHKIKNELSGVSQQMARVRSEGRLILTGTPLQNNLHELWALLRYLETDVFEESDVFDGKYFKQWIYYLF